MGGYAVLTDAIDRASCIDRDVTPTEIKGRVKVVDKELVVAETCLVPRVTRCRQARLRTITVADVKVRVAPLRLELQAERAPTHFCRNPKAVVVVFAHAQDSVERVSASV